MLKPDWLKEEKMLERDDGKTMVQAKLGDMMITLKNLVELEYVELSHDEIISSDNLSMLITHMIGGGDPTFYKEAINSKEARK